MHAPVRHLKSQQVKLPLLAYTLTADKVLHTACMVHMLLCPLKDALKIALLVGHCLVQLQTGTGWSGRTMWVGASKHSQRCEQPPY